MDVDIELKIQFRSASLAKKLRLGGVSERSTSKLKPGSVSSVACHGYPSSFAQVLFLQMPQLLVFLLDIWLRPFLLLPHPRKMQESQHCSMRAVCLEEMLPLGADHQALHQGRVGEESLRKCENHKAVEIIDTIIHLSSPKHRQRHPVHPPADWLIVKY